MGSSLIVDRRLSISKGYESLARYIRIAYTGNHVYGRNIDSNRLNDGNGSFPAVQLIRAGRLGRMATFGQLLPFAGNERMAGLPSYPVIQLQAFAGTFARHQPLLNSGQQPLIFATCS